MIDKIYCDLDGVLADFDHGVYELTGFYPTENSNDPGDIKADQRMWNAIKNANNFYLDLKLCKDAMKLWKYISSKYDTEILTAIPHRYTVPNAEQQKREWVTRHLGEDVKMHIGPYSKDKKKFAKPGYLLIDDRQSNVDEWIGNGGISILHKYNNVDTTLIKIKLAGI